jgi:hypothetical protein
MKTLRLKEKHPMHQKVQKVFDLMDELGLTFEIVSGYCIVRDHKSDRIPGPGERVDLQYIEDSDGYDGCLPPVTEYKLVFDDYSEEQAEEVIES